jgi:hypothetical protein
VVENWKVGGAVAAFSMTFWPFDSTSLSFWASGTKWSEARQIRLLTEKNLWGESIAGVWDGSQNSNAPALHIICNVTQIPTAIF